LSDISIEEKINPVLNINSNKMNNKFLIVIIVLLLLAVSLYSQQTGKYTDPRDGKTYKTITIGTQIWMAENLNYATSDSWCDQCSIYGRLYTYDAAVNACPSGWHLPTDAEWTVLTDYLDGESVAGAKLTSKKGWASFANAGATNSSKFTALPGGRRMENGEIWNRNEGADWWTSTEYSSNEAWMRIICSFGSGCKIERLQTTKNYGYSVRCVKD
jgi:uncharacterized protein (TIGR02145 family)